MSFRLVFARVLHRFIFYYHTDQGLLVVICIKINYLTKVNLHWYLRVAQNIILRL